MSVSSVSSSASVSSSSTTSVATSSLIANYDTFLTILMTQLQTQNPLEPMDTEAFTQQLVQYSSVEQQIQTNSKLDDLLSGLSSNSTMQLVNYLGKTVTAYGDTTKFENGACSWQVDASAAASNATVTITNSVGAVVYSGKVDLTEGANTFSWDGSAANGVDWSSSEDSYTLSISGNDADGKAVSITTEVSGTVDSIDTSSSVPYLTVNGKVVPLSGLISIDN